MVLYPVVMVAIIVALDFTLLRHNTGLRLAVNVGIVAAFVAGYFIILRRR